jgi:hypothetical protein
VQPEARHLAIDRAAADERISMLVAVLSLSVIISVSSFETV